MTTDNKGFKLLEEKIDRLISLVSELRQEREELREKLRECESHAAKLGDELSMYKDSDQGSFSLPDVKELLDAIKEERTVVRDSIRGALRLINE